MYAFVKACSPKPKKVAESCHYESCFNGCCSPKLSLPPFAARSVSTCGVNSAARLVSAHCAHPTPSAALIHDTFRIFAHLAATIIILPFTGQFVGGATWARDCLDQCLDSCCASATQFKVPFLVVPSLIRGTCSCRED